MQVDESNMVLEVESATLIQLSGFYEWSKIVATKFLAGYNNTILANLRRDIVSRCPKTYGPIGSTRFNMLPIP